MQISSILQQYLVDDLLLVATDTRHQVIRNPGLVDAVGIGLQAICPSWKPLSTHLAFVLRKLSCLSVLMVSTHCLVTQFFGLTFLMSTR